MLVCESEASLFSFSGKHIFNFYLLIIKFHIDECPFKESIKINILFTKLLQIIVQLGIVIS